MPNRRLQVEALLFSSGKKMDVTQLAELTESTKEQVMQELQNLKRDYEERETAIVLFEEGEVWKMNVREAYLPLVERIIADTELLMPVMETLAVIAHLKTPIQADVVKVRGSGAYEHIAELVKLGFVTKLPDGRTFRLKLSEKFFEYFDIQEQDDIDSFFEQVPKPIPVIPEEPKQKEDQQELLKVEMSEEEKATHKDFLDEMETRIAQASEKNDALEKDETFMQYRERKETQGEDSSAEEADTLTAGESTILTPMPDLNTIQEEGKKEEDEPFIPEEAPLTIPKEDRTSTTEEKPAEEKEETLPQVEKEKEAQ